MARTAAQTERGSKPSAKGDPKTGGSLERYWAKRDFGKTPEPRGTQEKSGDAPVFVIQKHHASHLHYDFRLEVDGVMKSWAVPKGPSYDPSVRRMAVQVEDHPISYNSFEGTIPKGQYGAGTVIIWDRGTWEPVGDPRRGLAAGKLAFRMHGQKMNGLWELIRMRKPGEERQVPWLLFKKHDEFERAADDYDVVAALPDSVVSKAKPAKAITRERPAAPPPTAKAAGKAAVGAVGTTKVTHPQRVIDSSTGITKLELVRYYESVADWMVPHLKGRACALLRGPSGIEGQLFFQKHLDRVRIAQVKQLDRALWPEHEPLLEVPSATALVAAAQMNVIEFHTWNSLVKNFDKPDRIVFDLDPGEGVKWKQVQEGTALTRSLLEQLGLEGWLKTSGGKGLHVVVPIASRLDWATVRAFAQAVVEQLARVIPDRFVAKSGPANRVGKIFVDYLRNTHGATTAAAYSARARPGLGVSMPIDWDQLSELKSGAQWTIKDAPGYLSLRQEDPWKDYWTSRQSISKAMKSLGVSAAQT
jgi:DNA ligase D-like protein (predicted polymerase)/DNA ligase D-like protein (predicted 3'-phosphoesterase)